MAALDATNTLVKRYAYLPGQLTPVAMTVEGATYYFLNNHLGFPRKLVDNNETVVWTSTSQVFGLATVDEDPDGDGHAVVNNIRFPGQYFDQETGLHYNYFRYYDPQTGRYLTPDPIGLVGGINHYSYCLNNPVNFVDPIGLIKLRQLLAGIGVGVSGIIIAGTGAYVTYVLLTGEAALAIPTGGASLLVTLHTIGAGGNIIAAGATVFKIGVDMVRDALESEHPTVGADMVTDALLEDSPESK